MNRRFWLTGLGAALTSAVGVAGEIIRRTYVRNYCHLPCYDYQTSFPTNPRSEVSTLSLPLTPAGDSLEPLVVPSRKLLEAGAAQKTKVFQLARSALRNDHCQLEQVTMTIIEDGTWIVSFRASQDPALVGEQRRPAYERYARNFLCVTVRGVGVMPVPDPGDNSVLGKPEYCKLDLAPLRLEKRESRHIRLTGRSAEVARFFARISQVEFDLCYE